MKRLLTVLIFSLIASNVSLAQTGAKTQMSESSPAPAPGVEKEAEVFTKLKDIAGFQDPRGFKDFFDKFRDALGRGDDKSISTMIGYPLKINLSNGHHKTISKASDLKRTFKIAFPDDVRDSVKNQKFEDLFVRDQGAMVGNGELWFKSNKEGKPLLVINAKK